MDTLVSLPQSEHLFLLIGSNPLPNAVAGKLLTAPGGKITFLCSHDSFQVALRLQGWLKDQGFPKENLRHPKKVGESQPASIAQGVHAELQAVNARRVGLHYTGGTKAMSVHAYRVVEQWAQERRKKGQEVETVFSYLDARTLQMVFDPPDPTSGERGHTEYIGQAVKLQLKDLLKLHDWILKHEPTTQPTLPATARALALTCTESSAFQDWQQWIQDELRAKCRRPNKEEWKGANALSSVSLSLPELSSLAEIVRTLQSDINLASGNLTLQQAAFGESAEHFCEWLDGKWLEHHVLDVLNHLAPNLELEQCAQNIETQEVQFDVDVVALRGYQLFAFSCSTGSKKGLLKTKLFEAYIRARQLGGDEGRIALVCCSNDPDGLEYEMRRDVDPEGRIRVFGSKHLADLVTHVGQWIRSQSKEA